MKIIFFLAFFYFQSAEAAKLANCQWIDGPQQIDVSCEDCSRNSRAVRTQVIRKLNNFVCSGLIECSEVADRNIGSRGQLTKKPVMCLSQRYAVCPTAQACLEDKTPIRVEQVRIDSEPTIDLPKVRK